MLVIYFWNYTFAKYHQYVLFKIKFIFLKNTYYLKKSKDDS